MPDVFVRRNHFYRRNSLDLRARRWFKQKNDPGAVILHSEFPRCVVNPCEWMVIMVVINGVYHGKSYSNES